MPEARGAGSLERRPAGTPARSSDWLSLALALGSAAACIVIIGARGWPLPFTACALAAAGMAGMWRGKRDVAALAFATGALALFAALPLRVMMLWGMLPVVGALLVAYRFKAPWFTRGEMNRGMVAWIAVIVAISAGALVAWWAIVRPDLSGVAFPPWLRALPSALVAVLLLAWAFVNAVAEEFYFRGALQHALVETLGPAGVLVQAVAFGAFHLHGVPSGASGVALATIFGLMMGILRQRARGLLAPWVAHVAADIAIVLIIGAATR